MATLAPAGEAPSRYLALSRRRLTIAAVTPGADGITGFSPSDDPRTCVDNVPGAAEALADGSRWAAMA